jgi:hypothetical protein
MYRMLGLALLVACGGAPPVGTEQPGPRGLHADQHLAIASREEARANDLATWPETRPGAADSPDRHLVSPGWSGTWDTSEEHRKRATFHRSAAAQLQADYDEACGNTPAEVASKSPLERYGIGGTPTADGTSVLLSPDAGPPDRLLVELRCHRAWMMLGRSDMADCPLDLPGLHVSAHGDAQSIELNLTVEDAKLVPELQRRAAHDLETAAHARKEAPAPNRAPPSTSQSEFKR